LPRAKDFSMTGTLPAPTDSLAEHNIP
jgi:hypothetical protein